MNRALWLLIGLRTRGWFRYLGRSLRTVKGALLALVGLGVFVPWLLSVLVAVPQGGRFSPETMRRSGPALLLLYCLMNVLVSTGEKAIYFSPAEVNFLFPGPFTRRQVLAYKVVSSLLVSLPTTLIMAAVLRVEGSWFPAAYVGLLLIFVFMQLFGMTVNLVATSVGARLYTRARKLVFAGVVALAVLIVVQAAHAPAGWNPRDLFERAVDTPAWQTVSTPLRWLFEAFLAPRLWPDLVLYGLGGLAVDLTLLGVVFALDAHYLEAAAASSARIYARIQRLRGRSVDGDEGSGRKPRLSVPGLPYWGGIGPIFWRQLTMAVRGLGRLVLVLAVLGFVLAGPLVSSAVSQGEESVVAVLSGVVLWMTVFLTALVPFDFRGDVDRLALLKTLPLPAWRLAVGQLLTPVVLMSAMQCLVLGVVLALSPSSRPFVLGFAAFTVPFNFFLFAMENLLFLFFPTRLAAATPGDFQALGRNFLFLMAKMTGLVLVALLSGVAFLVTYALTGGWGHLARGRWEWGGPLVAALAAAWSVLTLSGLALVPAVAFAFNVFDVGRDTPP